jgi:hypothetical protein
MNFRGPDPSFVVLSPDTLKAQIHCDRPGVGYTPMNPRGVTAMKKSATAFNIGETHSDPPHAPARFRFVLIAAVLLFVSCTAALSQYDPCALTWREVGRRDSTNSPGKLVSQAVAHDSRRGRTILFGGNNPFSGVFYTDQTWEWDGFLWTEMNPPTRPPERRGAAMACHHDQG